jgi:hypothetical protein
MFISFEEVSKMKLIIFVLTFFSSIYVTYIDSTSSPLSFFAIFVTYFHAIIVKALAFCETLNDELSLSLDTFDCKVKPYISSR